MSFLKSAVHLVQENNMKQKIKKKLYRIQCMYMKNPLKMFCKNPQIFWYSTVPYISFLIATMWIKPTLLRKNEKKNYIDIFISCGEVHLYAFFCIFSQKKTFSITNSCKRNWLSRSSLLAWTKNAHSLHKGR